MTAESQTHAQKKNHAPYDKENKALRPYLETQHYRNVEDWVQTLSIKGPTNYQFVAEDPPGKDSPRNVGMTSGPTRVTNFCDAKIKATEYHGRPMLPQTPQPDQRKRRKPSIYESLPADPFSLSPTLNATREEANTVLQTEKEIAKVNYTYRKIKKAVDHRAKKRDSKEAKALERD